MPAAKLILKTPGNEAVIYNLGGTQRIGRDPDNTVVLDDVSVSRHHAEIIQTDETYHLQDLNSSNGTAINGLQSSKADLQEGDRVLFGGIECVFTFFDPGETQARPLVKQPTPIDKSANSKGNLKRRHNEIVDAIPAPVYAPILGWFLVSAAPAILLVMLYRSAPESGEFQASPGHLIYIPTPSSSSVGRVFPFVFVSLVMWPWALATIRLGLRLKSPPALRVIEKDRRSPILYLRSFAHDAIIDSAAIPSEESRIAGILAKLGPILAIGKPGERLPELGAARLYATQNRWQEIAATLIHSAQIVVMRAGFTEGLAWELRRVMQQISAHRFVLFVPFAKEPPVYASFRSFVAEHAGITLPADMGNHLLVAFNDDWTPRFFPVVPERGLMLASERRDRERKSELHSLVKEYQTSSIQSSHQSLRAMLESLAIHSVRPPHYRWSLYTWCLAGVWAAFMLLVPMRFVTVLMGLKLFVHSTPGDILCEVLVVSILMLTLSARRYATAPEDQRGYERICRNFLYAVLAIRSIYLCLALLFIYALHQSHFK